MQVLYFYNDGSSLPLQSETARKEICMFIVKCTIAGTLSVILERGSVTLTNGQTFDIEDYCSRRWIRTDQVFNRFIKEQRLIVVFDSEEKIPGHPTGDAVTTKASAYKSKSKQAETVIVDFSDIPDPEDLDKLDDFVEGKISEGDLGFSKTDVAESVDVEEPPTDSGSNQADSDSGVEDDSYTKEVLESLAWNELRKTAKRHGIKTYRKSADELVSEILNR